MKKIILTTGLLGILGVSLGAFGAHGLEQTLAERGTTSAWETAVLYHLLHTVALFALCQNHVGPWHQIGRIAWTWSLGILFFSGSLYILSLGGPRWLGPVTPLGGVFLIAGWALVAWNGVRGKAAS